MRWQHKIRLADVFHDEDRTFLERRDAIVLRCKTQLRRIYSESEDLQYLLEELSETEDEDQFDEIWNDFYDWCDDNQVWVATV